MNFADHTTKDLIRLRTAQAGWDKPFDGNREDLIEDIRHRQNCRGRHIQRERPGVVVYEA